MWVFAALKPSQSRIGGDDGGNRTNPGGTTRKNKHHRRTQTAYSHGRQEFAGLPRFPGETRQAGRDPCTLYCKIVTLNYKRLHFKL